MSDELQLFFSKRISALEADVWLRTIEEQEDTFIDQIIRRFNFCRANDRMHEIDKFLQDVDVKRYEPVILLTMLTFTRPYSPSLPSRGDFFDRAKAQMMLVLQDEKRVKKLTNHLI